MTAGIEAPGGGPGPTRTPAAGRSPPASMPGPGRIAPLRRAALGYTVSAAGSAACGRCRPEESRPGPSTRAGRVPPAPWRWRALGCATVLRRRTTSGRRSMRFRRRTGSTGSPDRQKSGPSTPRPRRATGLRRGHRRREHGKVRIASAKSNPRQADQGRPGRAAAGRSPPAGPSIPGRSRSRRGGRRRTGCRRNGRTRPPRGSPPIFLPPRRTVSEFVSERDPTRRSPRPVVDHGQGSPRGAGAVRLPAGRFRVPVYERKRTREAPRGGVGGVLDL